MLDKIFFRFVVMVVSLYRLENYVDFRLNYLCHSGIKTRPKQLVIIVVLTMVTM